MKKASEKSGDFLMFVWVLSFKSDRKIIEKNKSIEKPASLLLLQNFCIVAQTKYKFY